jgi:Asp-tRNA(Asn)/Glu-tRNA(Gln) amidotransferase A subunit family amidase
MPAVGEGFSMWTILGGLGAYRQQYRRRGMSVGGGVRRRRRSEKAALNFQSSNWYIILTGHPAISVPCEFIEERLPVGIQIVRRHQDDFGALQVAYAFEQAT